MKRTSFWSQKLEKNLRHYGTRRLVCGFFWASVFAPARRKLIHQTRNGGWSWSDLYEAEQWTADPLQSQRRFSIFEAARSPASWRWSSSCPPPRSACSSFPRSCCYKTPLLLGAIFSSILRLIELGSSVLIFFFGLSSDQLLPGNGYPFNLY